MTGTCWEHFPHAADMGIRGSGPSREAAFEQAAMALCALTTDLATVRAETEVEISCEATDDEILLVDWLNALVYEMACRHMVFSTFRVELRDHRLEGLARGEPLDPERHPPGVEVKGATYTELSVRKDDRGVWVAQCVVDV